MNRISKVISAIMLIISVVIATGCTKPDEPNNGGNNGNNGGNGGETPEMPTIVSTSEVQYDGTVYVEAVFEDESKMYFEILSANEVALVNGEFYYQDNPSLVYMYRGEVVIPEIINHFGTTYSVVSIAKKAFYHNEIVTSVFIPNTVQHIDSYWYFSYNWITCGAFQGCINLKHIHMSENVQRIGKYAFSDCLCYEDSVTIPNRVKRIEDAAFDSKMVIFNADSCYVAGGRVVDPDHPTGEDIYISAFPKMNTINFGTNVKVLPAYLFSNLNPTFFDIPSSVTVLSYEAFRNCSDLEKVNNLENVTEIGFGAFYECTSLNSVTLNSTLTHIGSSVFYGCWNLTSIAIPNSIITIGHSAFAKSGLCTIEWGNSIDTIGQRAFERCRNLTEVVIPNTVSTIGLSAFENCKSLMSASIGDAVTSIESHTFYGCEELCSVSFGHSVTKIGVAAFKDCRKLTEISLPSTIRLIYDNAFDECNIHYITCMANNPPELRENVFEYGRIQAIYVPMTSVEAYKTAHGWSECADRIVGI